MHSLLCALSAPSFFLGQTDRDVVARIISGILCLLVVCLGIRLGFNGGSLEVILYKTTELLYFILNAGVCYLCHSISQAVAQQRAFACQRARVKRKARS